MDRVLVFTVTATGYPIQSRYGIYPKPSELAMYATARIIRLTYQTFSLSGEKEGTLLETVDMWINSGKPAINEKSVERTGITREWMEKQTCHTVQEFSDRFFANHCPVVCYNASLHLHLFASELYRNGLHAQLDTLMGLLPNVFCLMQQSVEICAIPSERKSSRFKIPSLIEICRCLGEKEEDDEKDVTQKTLNYLARVSCCFFHLKSLYYGGGRITT